MEEIQFIEKLKLHFQFFSVQNKFDQVQHS